MPSRELVIAILMLASAPCLTRAQSVDEATLTAWLARAWTEAGEFPPLRGKVVVWEEQSDVLVLTHKYSCSADGTRWRHDLFRDNKLVSTAVRGSDVAWNSSATSLTLINPQDIPAPYQPRETSRNFWQQLGRLTYGGLSMGATAGVSPEAAVLTAEGWSQRACVTAGDAGQFCVRTDGKWDPQTNRGLVVSNVITSHPNPDAVGSMEEYEELSGGPERKLMPLYARVTTFGPKGDIQRVLTLRSIEDITSQADAQFATPAPTSDQQVVDLRRGYTIVGDREFTVVPLDSELAKTAQSRGAATVAPIGALTWAGWGIAIVIVVGVSVMVWRRRSPQARSSE